MVPKSRVSLSLCLPLRETGRFLDALGDTKYKLARVGGPTERRFFGVMAARRLIPEWRGTFQGFLI